MNVATPRRPCPVPLPGAPGAGRTIVGALDDRLAHGHHAQHHQRARPAGLDCTPADGRSGSAAGTARLAGDEARLGQQYASRPPTPVTASCTVWDRGGGGQGGHPCGGQRAMLQAPWRR